MLYSKGCILFCAKGVGSVILKFYVLFQGRKTKTTKTQMTKGAIFFQSWNILSRREHAMIEGRTFKESQVLKARWENTLKNQKIMLKLTGNTVWLSTFFAHLSIASSSSSEYRQPFKHHFPLIHSAWQTVPTSKGWRPWHMQTFWGPRINPGASDRPLICRDGGDPEKILYLPFLSCRFFFRILCVAVAKQKLLKTGLNFGFRIPSRCNPKNGPSIIDYQFTDSIQPSKGFLW